MRSVLACLLFAALVPTSALAQDEDALDQRARIHFQSGTAYFDAGDYEAALREFQSAYDLSERPGLLYNVYLTHERLGHLAEAADNLRRYLDDADVPDERRQMLQLRLENLHRRIEAQGDHTADGAAPETPEATPNTAPSPPDTSGDTGAAPGATAASAPPPPDDEGGGVPVAAIVSFGVGGAGAILWATFGILAMTEDARLSEDCPCSEDELSNLETYDLLGDIGFGVTLAGAAAGVLLLALSGGDDEEDPSAVALSPWMQPRGAGLAARGAF